MRRSRGRDGMSLGGGSGGLCASRGRIHKQPRSESKSKSSKTVRIRCSKDETEWR